MKWKIFMSSILSAFIGFIIGMLISMVINFVINVNQAVSGLVVLLFALLGIYLGVTFNKTKNVYYHIFKPSKVNVAISLFISSGMYFFWIIFYRERGFINTFNFEAVDNLFLLLPIGIIFAAIFFYPFSASAYFIYKNDNRIIQKKTKLVIIAILILLNPLSFYWFSINNARRDFNNMYEVCGVEVLDIFDESNLKNSGISAGDIIIGIDDIKISTVDEITAFLSIVNSAKNITVVTETDSFLTTPYFDEQDKNYKLGLLLDQKICKK